MADSTEAKSPRTFVVVMNHHCLLPNEIIPVQKKKRLKRLDTNMSVLIAPYTCILVVLERAGLRHWFSEEILFRLT